MLGRFRRRPPAPAPAPAPAAPPPRRFAPEKLLVSGRALERGTDDDIAAAAMAHLSRMAVEGLRREEELPPLALACFSAWQLSGEVFNGGFTQYFHNLANRSDDWSGIAPALHEIRAERHLEVWTRAAAWRAAQPHAPDALQSTPEPLAALSKEWWALPSIGHYVARALRAAELLTPVPAEELETRTQALIRSHPE